MATEEFNPNITLLYKETEQKYLNDDSVDADDTMFLCDELYRHELCMVFNVVNNDFDELTRRVTNLYERVKTDPDIINLIQLHMFMDDEVCSFMGLFSFEMLYATYPLIVDILTDK